MPPDATLPAGPTPNAGTGPEPPSGALPEPSAVLLAGVRSALPGWVLGCVVLRTGGNADEATLAAARAAGDRAAAEVGAELEALLALDPDRQPTGPLAVLRSAVRYPTAVLAAAGVPPVPRDAFAERVFPEDIYDLSPATWSDVDPALHEAGLVWGAWKAHEHLRRRKGVGPGPVPPAG